MNKTILNRIAESNALHLSTYNLPGVNYSVYTLWEAGCLAHYLVERSSLNVMGTVIREELNTLLDLGSKS